MTDMAMLPAIRAAIKANEIGSGDPYVLSFAKKGRSGASFGIFQNDTEANPDALDTLTSILQGAGLPDDQVARITGLLSKPCPEDPLTADDETAANEALSSPNGKQAVDALDAKRLVVVCGYLDRAVQASISPIDGEAQLGICMWCNMTGPPTAMLPWLGGSAINEYGGTVAAPDSPVTFDNLSDFLKKTRYFTNNPRNWTHFSDSAAEGAKQLPSKYMSLAMDQRSVGLVAADTAFAKALLALTQKLTGDAAGLRAPFPHGIGSIEVSATVNLQGFQFSLKIEDRKSEQKSGQIKDYIRSCSATDILDYCVELDTDNDDAMTDCNAFVKKVANKFGVALDPTLDADGIVAAFESAPFTKRTTDSSTAMSWANDGLVVAGMTKGQLNNYGPHNNGHVAIVHNTADPTHPAFPMASWGSLGGRGKSNSSIRQSFPAKACDSNDPNKTIHYAFAPTI